MSHTVRHQTKLLHRVRRLRGQVEGLERALEREEGCDEIVHLIAAARGALNGLMAVVVEDHIRAHVFPSARAGSKAAEAAEELVDVVRTYLK